jgi:glucokinase
MKKQNLVGVDLGGTAIKLAIVTTDGEIAYKTSEPTVVEAGAEGIFAQINAMIDTCCEQLKIDRKTLLGIGIGAPAFLDIERGYVKEAVNLGWKDLFLKDRLEEVTNLPVHVDNDANVAAIGEMWRGAGTSQQELLCITLGTGVGSGVIINGDIHHGANDTAGEFGHVTVLPQGGFPCNCGKEGCIETIASATGLVRLTKEQLKAGRESSLQVNFKENGTISAKEVAQAADQGDELAIEIFYTIASFLGLALGNYAVTLNPGKIVVGGGLSQAGEVLFSPLRKAYKQYALPHLTGDIEIVPATLGNDAGVIGAAWLAKH